MTTPAEALACQRHSPSESSLMEPIASVLAFTLTVLAMHSAENGLIIGRTVEATYSRREIASISALARTQWVPGQHRGKVWVSVIFHLNWHIGISSRC